MHHDCVLNPLTIPLVVSRALYFCDDSSLKRCRMVNKTWLNEADKYFKVKKIPLIVDKVNLSSVTNSLSASSSNYVIISEDVDNSSESFFQLKAIFCKSQHVQFLELRNQPWSVERLAEIFVSLPNLIDLTLAEDFVLPKVTSHEVNSSCSTWLPKLQCLHLNLKDENLQNLANLQFLTEIYKNAPKLEKITSWTCNDPSGPDLSSTIFSEVLFRSLFTLDSMITHWTHLTDLDINLDLRNNDLDLISQSSALFKLRSLSLTLNLSISYTKLDLALAKLAPSLKRLKLTYKNCIRKSPDLKNLYGLEYLEFNGVGCDKMRRRYSTESLKTQYFQYYYMYNIVPATLFPFNNESGQCQISLLKELQINSVYYVPNDILSLNQFFPRITTLRVSYLDDSLLRSVIASFPNLLSLCASDGFFTDEGLTGISMEVQDIIGDSTVIRTRLLREYPSIVDLKDLKILSLSSKRITNFGVIHGISLMESIQELSLNTPEVTDKGFVEIIRKMDLFSCKFKSDVISPNVIRFAKERYGAGFTHVE